MKITKKRPGIRKLNVSRAPRLADEDFIFDIQEFPGCCQARVWCDFYTSTTGYRYEGQAPFGSEEVKLDWNNIDSLVEEVRYEAERDGSTIFAILAPEQKIEAKVLLAVGFTVTGKFKGMRGRALTSYIYVPKKKKVRSR